ncbi:hypothetical protein A3F28_02495 [Candidatus Uhrbacteria bacterium RIFCSPHIGHO2_12_FULL_57_11]|uniref:Uncharacterized protein n=2 Tax=Candidatus Uhriibacteriota TaxID=1752732 RepID=A0A1F7UKA9_9BACT|nr:MAG: hypothetical protein A3D72_04135 [Candidatus Uhrbacteria bacterium RIFCSPHIGHO2_02_FULL_57_19]OGL78721.1 MAG: hypothetical protein A3F28_02495 [Candidatus Uhrbacteria bacterium RIFCSPHIGHO2_12_FULL_57_11]
MGSESKSGGSPETTETPEAGPQQPKSPDLSRAIIREADPVTSMLNMMDSIAKESARVQKALEAEETKAVIWSGDTAEQKKQQTKKKQRQAELGAQFDALQGQAEILNEVKNEVLKGRSVQEVITEFRTDAEKSVEEAQEKLVEIYSDFAKEKITEAGKGSRIAEVVGPAQEAEKRRDFLLKMEKELPAGE